MARFLLSFAVLIAGTAFWSTEAAAQAKFPKAVLRPELWEKVSVATSQECEGTAKECSLRFLEGAGLAIETKPAISEYRLGEVEGRSLTIVFVAYKVSNDDSVTGIRYRLAVSLGDVEDRSYILENLGRQYTCARGHRNWSRALCP